MKMLPERALKQRPFTNQPLVSILMPVYNSMDFVRSEGFQLLPKSLDSLLDQSFSNFELIILDNQSTDGTSDICKSYAAKDYRIRYILDTQKRFPEGGINHLATFIRGKYCMVANDDDLWHPDYIKRMVEYLEQYPEVDMAYSNGEYINPDGTAAGKIISSKIYTYKETTSGLSNYSLYITKRNVIPIAFGIFKSEVYRRTLPFEDFDELKANVDNLFIAKYFLSGYTCHYLDDTLFYYRKKGRFLDPSKIPNMPGLEKPILIWLYYVRHQFYFYKKLNEIAFSFNLSKMKYNYVKCITFYSFIKHSINLLNWIKNEYVHDERDKDICLKIFSFIGRELNPLLLDGPIIGLFQDDADNNIRFQPEVVVRLLDLTVRRNKAVVGVIRYYMTLAREDGESEIVKEFEELLQKEISVFEEEKMFVKSKLGRIPEIIIKKDIKWNEPVEYNNENPKLSIITCSKNLGQFLEETILSVARQSFKDYEHIVIDGGSTDETLEILKRYPYIRWISEKDSSPLEALKKGLALAKGKYVMQCCVSDGYIDTDWFQRCVELLDSDPEVSLVWGFPQYLTEDSKLGDISYSQFHRSSPPQKQEWFLYWLRTNFWLPEGNFCVRKEVFNKCFPPYNKRSKNLEPYLEFNYNFNTLGYMPYHIPIVANFGRTHKNQLGQKESESGIGGGKMKKYLIKVEYYRCKLSVGIVTHVFRDGAHNPLPVQFSKRKIRHESIRTIFINLPVYFYQYFSKYLSVAFKTKIKRILKR